MIRRNLGPESEPWAKSIDRRLDNLEAADKGRREVSPASIRDTVANKFSSPHLISYTLNLSAPASGKVASHLIPVPDGVVSAFLYPPYPARMRANEARLVETRWVSTAGDVEDDFSEYQAPDFSSILGLVALVEWGANWASVFDSFGGAAVDTTGQDDIEVCFWSFDPASVRADEILSVDFVQVVLWSFERVATWGT